MNPVTDVDFLRLLPSNLGHRRPRDVYDDLRWRLTPAEFRRQLWRLVEAGYVAVTRENRLHLTERGLHLVNLRAQFDASVHDLTGPPPNQPLLERLRWAINDERSRLLTYARLCSCADGREISVLAQKTTAAYDDVVKLVDSLTEQLQTVLDNAINNRHDCLANANDATTNAHES